MALSEALTRQFYEWELRGRGWLQYPHAVALEPPFRPFPGFRLPPSRDDARRHTFFSALFDRAAEPEDEPDKGSEPGPGEPSHTPTHEILLAIPEDASLPAKLAEVWTMALHACRGALSFEVAARHGRADLILSGEADNLAFALRQLRSLVPEVEAIRAPGALEAVWSAGKERFAIAHLGLAREFLLPLSNLRELQADPLALLLSAVSELEKDECAVLQILLEPARAPWGESIRRAVVLPDGGPFFPDSPEIAREGQAKATDLFFAVVVRLAAASPRDAWTILRQMAGSLGATRGTNSLIPLSEEDDTPLEDLLLLRQTNRPGMLLGSRELAALVHLPDTSSKLLLRPERAGTAPRYGEGVLLGTTERRGEVLPVHLPDALRLRHVHVAGATGTGKSTLLLSLIQQDIERGAGVALLDPHGDLVEEVLARIPPERERDVVLLDPADEAPAAWNILEARSEGEARLLASDLVGIIRRLSTSWGDQMTSVLGNAVAAFLEHPRGGTLLDLKRFLSDERFRAGVLAEVADPYTIEFWREEFRHVGDKSLGPLLTRLDLLLRAKPARAVLGARSGLDLRALIEERRIILAKLSVGLLGEEVATLLGSLLVAKLHQVALSRQEIDAAARHPIFLYADECQYFATPSVALLLSGARKFGLSLTLSHQSLRQLSASQGEVSSALLGNAATRVVFRVGEEDAKALERGFASFSADDLSRLSVGQAICRIERSDADFRLSTSPLPPLPEDARERRTRIRVRSRERWGVRREAVGTPPPPRSSEARAASPEAAVVPVPAPFVVSEPPPAPPIPPAPVEPRRPGKGGAEHTYLQELIKRSAEELGFRASVEEQVLGSRESIDLALYRGGVRIACEITVTTPPEHEVGNVLKCLLAGFETVAVVGVKRSRLDKVGKLLNEKLAPEERQLVNLFTPEELLAWLAAFPALEEEGEVGGYKVKVRYRPPQDARSKRVAEILAKSMSRLRKES